MDFGKLPPQAKEMEIEVIGACLLDNQAVITALNILHSDCFYVDAHVRIWRSITALYADNKAVDLSTVTEQLRKHGDLDAAGGPHYVATTTNAVGSSANVEFHAYVVKEKYIARKIINCCSTAISGAYEDTEDIFMIIEGLQNELLNLNGEINKTREVTFATAVQERVIELKEAAENKTYKTGNIVYLDSLDRKTGGWQNSDLIILAGRPAMGKTALAVWCAAQQAKHNVPVGFISLEMATPQLIDRIISSESEIDLEIIRKGGMKKEQWERFDLKTGRMLDYPLFIDDRGGLKINEVCNTITNWVIKHKVKSVYLDYLQLVGASGDKRNSSREQDVSEVTRKLKALAKNLNIPIIALSQLSRKVEEREDKRPMLSDLRESGAIEQDADMVIFPFCESYYNENADPLLCELIIAKYRNGKPGFTEVNFVKEFQKFTDRDRYNPQGFTPIAEAISRPMYKDDTPF